MSLCVMEVSVNYVVVRHLLMGLMLLVLEWESDMIKDTICMLLLMAFGLAFCTNAVTTEYNMWALMARFGGAG